MLCLDRRINVKERRKRHEFFKPDARQAQLCHISENIKVPHLKATEEDEKHPKKKIKQEVEKERKKAYHKV